MKVSPYAGETLLVGILLSPLTWRATSGLGYYSTQGSLVLLGEVAQSLCCPGGCQAYGQGSPGIFLEAVTNAEVPVSWGVGVGWFICTSQHPSI